MLEQIKKRLLYTKDNNLFDAHYINDMEYLISEVERLEYERGLLSLKLHGELKKERNQLQKALEQAKEFLSELYSLIGQDMDMNPSAKKVYLSKIAYANNTFISQALERSEPK